MRSRVRSRRDRKSQAHAALYASIHDEVYVKETDPPHHGQQLAKGNIGIHDVDE